MVTITEENRRKRFRAADEPIRELYGDIQLGEKLTELRMHFVPNTDKKTFIDCVGDTILGFYKTGELPRILQEQSDVSADDSQRIVSELIEFLSPVIERENKQKKDLTELADTIQKRGTETATQTQTTNDASEGVQPVRTMQRDINRIHGYGAQPQNEQDDGPVVKALSQEETFRPTSTQTPPPEEIAPTPTQTTQAPVSEPAQQESAPEENYQRIPIKRNTNEDTPHDKE